MELSGTLESFLQIKKILEYPTQLYVQAYVQEISRKPWTPLMSSTIV